MIVKLDGLDMKIHPEARLAENASLIGAVTVESGASIWYGAVLRGDCGAITVGENSAAEDNCVLHGEVTIGKNCIIGHGAILHGCTLEDGVLIGMGATVLDGSVIGKGSVVAAGALVTKNTLIPPNSMVMGVPAKIIGQTGPTQRETMSKGVMKYRELAQQLPLWEDIASCVPSFIQKVN